jgi:glycosyltransferase involved in cell wall biosynthesis
MTDTGQQPPRIGILFAQFAAYHVDRIEAAARALAGRAQVIGVEVAQASETYAWSPSGEVSGAVKRVLFSGVPYERIGKWRRFRAQYAALKDCATVFVGIGYNEPDVIALAWALRLSGCRMVLMTESKGDDFPRNALREKGKALLFLPYAAALVGGPRQVAYMRALGFRRRKVLMGYDGVGIARVRALGGDATVSPQERPFVFVGRFVAKKNIAFLIEAYHRYRQLAGATARRLVLVGGGELEGQVRAQIAALGLADAVEITGFVGAPQVAQRLASARALLLPSTEEQWGLVVNEALALDLPVAVSRAVGAHDTLVRNGVNGFVLASDDVGAWAEALFALGGNDDRWWAMSEASHALAPAGDAARFGEGVAALA